MVTSDRLIVHAPVQGDSGSGGYLEAIFRFAARELFGVHIPPEQQLPYKAQRNSDHQEVELIVPSFPLYVINDNDGDRVSQKLHKEDWS